MVCGFFCDRLLSEMHIMSNLILSSLKKFYRSSIWADNEEMLRCKTDKSSCSVHMEYRSHNLLSFQIDQIIDLLHEMFLTFL